MYKIVQIADSKEYTKTRPKEEEGAAYINLRSSGLLDTFKGDQSIWK